MAGETTGVALRLADLAARAGAPVPWSEGDNIPWNEPAYSGRMLREHLSEAHDAASRRAATVDRHVAWIQCQILAGKPSAVLDLGCGPGLYSSRLARLGHTCHGVDWSPASIAYARSTAAAEQLACRYTEADLRTADYGDGYGLALLIYGELNVFARADAAALLRRAAAALQPDGQLLLEVHTAAAIQALGQRPRSWYTAERGLWADTPHLVLDEHFWDAGTGTATIRYFVVDLADGAVRRYAQSMQGYTADEYGALLADAGFELRASYPSLLGDPDPADDSLYCLVARKRPA